MTPFEQCVLTVNKRLIDWKPVDNNWPIVLPWGELGEFMRSEFGIYEFIDTGYIMSPDDWPVNEDRICMCGDVAGDDVHYLLQYGADNEYEMGMTCWVEWEMWMHTQCVPGFIEMITGGTFYEDVHDWMAYRDDPMGPQ